MLGELETADSVKRRIALSPECGPHFFS